MDVRKLIKSSVEVLEDLKQIDFGLNQKGLIIKVFPLYFSWLISDKILRMHFDVQRCYASGEVENTYRIVLDLTNKIRVDYDGDQVESIEPEEEGGEVSWPIDSIGEYDYMRILDSAGLDVKQMLDDRLPSLFERGCFDKSQN